ncbi:hypothetical protein BN341_19350 [Helicobacter heilmannii ASB1.4]|uniref:Uncharacterized protein n=1 Tax=Helicobacter heilmannii TaxID=35817 RepID=A0A0K2Y3U3_HELHE|nr:hypothetical protein BN341_19330 [Helicobacter heilmannii ASB1.4]CCM73735.1 hypothetical protein BN341_19350 [Helicobacter heilmannii ASB1.4]CRI33776.1 hypothetical protein HHE01_14620 [Helicobacter heilmannii]
MWLSSKIFFKCGISTSFNTVMKPMAKNKAVRAASAKVLLLVCIY